MWHNQDGKRKGNELSDDNALDHQRQDAKSLERLLEAHLFSPNLLCCNDVCGRGMMHHAPTENPRRLQLSTPGEENKLNTVQVNLRRVRHAPQPDRAVVAGRCQQRTIRAENDALYASRVPLEDGELCPRCHIP